jgi:hypothetical protein
MMQELADKPVIDLNTKRPTPEWPAGEVQGGTPQVAIPQVAILQGGTLASLLIPQPCLVFLQSRV